MNKDIVFKITLLVFSFTGLFKSQIAVGKTTITNSSVLLEFASENKGIIVPQITTPTGSTGGTFVYNSTDRSVQVWEGRVSNGAGGWLSLTKNATPGVNHTLINSGSDVNTNNGAVIGSSTSTKIGVLVLESTTKALLLPNVSNPQINMRGSIAGTMVYDITSDTFAIYDGVNWSYWK